VANEQPPGNEHATAKANVDLVRTAFEAFARGDAVAVLEFVDRDLEWTFLDPSVRDPQPAVCHGRRQLADRLAHRSGRALPTELEEVVAVGKQVLAVTHIPGLDAFRARQADDRNYHLVTVEKGRITALRACRSREEAVALASPG